MAKAKAKGNGARRAAWRVTTLLLGAAVAAWAAIFAAQSLSLNDGQLRVSQGPHLYVRGRNYTGATKKPAGAEALQEADVPRTADASTRSQAEPS